MGERRVTGTPSQAQTPSIRDSRQPGGVAGTTESRPGLHSRQATAEPSASRPGVHRSGTRSYRPAEALPWRDIARLVELPLGPHQESTAVVESRVVPGSALGSCFARGYSWDDRASPVDMALSGHVPCLAQTTLTNAAGQMLFRALRQGFMYVPGIDQAAMMALNDLDLRRLVSKFIIGEWQFGSPENYERRVENRCRLIQDDEPYASGAAITIQYRVGVEMAMETAAAALYSDPDNFQRAVERKHPDIELFDVALLTRDDFQPWINQYCQLREWQDSCYLRLNLRGPDREPRTAYATVTARQFALSVEDQGPDFSSRRGLDECVVRLLGGTESRELGGDVLNRVDFLRSRVSQLGGELTAAGYEQVRTLPPQALERAVAFQKRNRVNALRAEMSRLDRHALALEQAGRQLKNMWCDHNAWPTGDDAYQAASRLALVAFLMGETPVLSCFSGRDFTGKLDAEVKILATVADCNGGHVPSPDMNTDHWDPARAVLRGP